MDCPYFIGDCSCKASPNLIPEEDCEYCVIKLKDAEIVQLKRGNRDIARIIWKYILKWGMSVDERNLLRAFCEVSRDGWSPEAPAREETPVALMLHGPIKQRGGELYREVESTGTDAPEETPVAPEGVCRTCGDSKCRLHGSNDSPRSGYGFASSCWRPKPSKGGEK